MVKFLDTTGVSHELATIIKEAKDKLYIISPYLQVSDIFKTILEDQDRMKIDIRIVYRENKLPLNENNWLKQLKSVRTSVCKNLHAKCFLNEKVALITTMNFFEYSQVSNIEMGLSVSKAQDEELYNQIFEEVKRIIRHSEEVKVTVEKIPSREEPVVSAQKHEVRTGEGFCIRCGTPIKRNVDKPYCLPHFQKWSEFKDAAYVEKNGKCHICGKDNDSSMDKPVCKDCYKAHKALFK